MTDFYVYVDGKLGCQDCGDFAEETAEEHARLVHGDAVDFVQYSRGRRHEPDDADGVIEVSREQVLRGRARLLDGMPVSTRERLRNLDHLLGWPPAAPESEAVAVLRELVARVNGCSCPCDCDDDDILDRAEALLAAAPETRTGPSEEAIDQAARALCAEWITTQIRGPVRQHCEYDRLTEGGRDVWRGMARAVAAALRAEA